MHGAHPCLLPGCGSAGLQGPPEQTRKTHPFTGRLEAHTGAKHAGSAPIKTLQSGGSPRKQGGLFPERPYSAPPMLPWGWAWRLGADASGAEVLGCLWPTLRRARQHPRTWSWSCAVTLCWAPPSATLLAHPEQPYSVLIKCNSNLTQRVIWGNSMTSGKSSTLHSSGAQRVLN